MPNDSAARKPRNGVPEHNEAKLSENLEKRIKAYAVAAGAAVAVMAAPAIAGANIVDVTLSSSSYGANSLPGGLAGGTVIVGLPWEGHGSHIWGHTYKGLTAPNHAVAQAGIGGGSVGVRLAASGGFLGKNVEVGGAAFGGYARLGSALFNLDHSHPSNPRTVRATVPGAHSTKSDCFFTRCPAVQRTGYVGLKFAGGSYGWAKVRAHADGLDSYSIRSNTATRGRVWGTILSIWKNTVPGAPILTGETLPTAPEPAVPLLTLLAIGAVALPMWRARRRAAPPGGTDATQA